MKRERALGKGLRMTRQRKAVLDAVRVAPSHPTADEVYRRVRSRLPHISLGTVYRNLELLSEHGLVSKLELGGGQRHYDGRTERHYHVRCLRCGRVEDVPIPPLTSADQAARRATDYRILGHHLEFVGVCPSCRTEEAQRCAGGQPASANPSEHPGDETPTNGDDPP